MAITLTSLNVSGNTSVGPGGLTRTIKTIWASSVACTTSISSPRVRIVDGHIRFYLPAIEVFAADERPTQYYGEAAFRLPALEIEASGYQKPEPIEGDAEITLPCLQIEASGYSLITGDVELTLPALSISATGTQGVSGNVEFELPALEINASGSVREEGVIEFELPALEIWGEAETTKEGYPLLAYDEDGENWRWQS